jgi:hypothetical protein
MIFYPGLHILYKNPYRSLNWDHHRKIRKSLVVKAPSEDVVDDLLLNTLKDIAIRQNICVLLIIRHKNQLSVRTKITEFAKHLSFHHFCDSISLILGKKVKVLKERNSHEGKSL